MECRAGRSIFLTLCCLERPRMSLRLSRALRLLWLLGENQQWRGRCQPPGDGGAPGLRWAKQCRTWEDTLESDRGQSPEVCCQQSAVFHVPALACTWVGVSPCPLQLVCALPHLRSHSPRAGGQARSILGQPWKPEGVRQAGGLCKGRAQGVGAGWHGRLPVRALPNVDSSTSLTCPESFGCH